MLTVLYNQGTKCELKKLYYLKKTVYKKSHFEFHKINLYNTVLQTKKDYVAGNNVQQTRLKQKH